MDNNYIIWFSDERSSDISQLGGKNALLGEMTRNMRGRGIPVPDGFAVTAGATGRSSTPVIFARQ
jgi:pyruvate,water dikinase